MKSLHVLEKGLDIALLRRKVLANNIANVDVPHFKRSEVSFESDLKRALDKQKAIEKESPLRSSHPLHITKRRYPTLGEIRERVHIDYNSSMRNDGNNVDIEDEITKLIRNQLQYNLVLERIGGSFRHLNKLLAPSI